MAKGGEVGRDHPRDVLLPHAVGREGQERGEERVGLQHGEGLVEIVRADQDGRHFGRRHTEDVPAGAQAGT